MLNVGAVLAALVAGLAVGFLIAWLWDRSRLGVLRERLGAAEHRLEEERQSDGEKLAWVESAQQHLRDAFQALARQALQGNAEEFLTRARDQLDILLTRARGDLSTHRAELETLVRPLEKTLATLDGQVRALEEKREGAYQSLQVQLNQLASTHQQLHSTTVNLVQALKSPVVRGRWGEIQLRRIVELAGMVEHVDFIEQVSTDSGRPDMIVSLPNRGVVPVDAKTPMHAYLDALEAPDDATRRAKLDAHARAMRQRVGELGDRRYFQQFPQAPEFVVMFVPNDACLGAAFERDPGIFDYAVELRVFMTTPATLLALLKTVAFGWQQQQIAENARQIADQGKELYDRFARFLEHLQKTGRGLDAAVKSYNEAVGSLESRVLPAARRLRELGAVTDELPPAEPVDRQARQPADRAPTGTP